MEFLEIAGSLSEIGLQRLVLDSCCLLCRDRQPYFNWFTLPNMNTDIDEKDIKGKGILILTTKEIRLPQGSFFA